jgi:type II secretory pathway component PulF
MSRKSEKTKTKAPDKTLGKYRFAALDEAGKKVSGTEMAYSTGAAHVALLARGLQPLEVTAKQSILKFEITKKKVPRQDILNFTRQLAVFMRAGIPIMEALEVIVEETQGKLMRSILLELIDSLRAGDTFATACSFHPAAFPNFYVGILESAELTGNLDIVLNQLADYIERDAKAKAKITAALIYPARPCSFRPAAFHGLLQVLARATPSSNPNNDERYGVHRALVVRRSSAPRHNRRWLHRDA